MNVEWRVARTWTDLQLNAATIAVDMPIGLASDGKRGCDEAARRTPNIRPSSIFPMPVRGALEYEDYAHANAWSKANGHGGIVKQAWNLRPKLLEIETVARDPSGIPIYEAHPELAFARLAGRTLEPKKTEVGRLQRLNLLRRTGISGLPAILRAVPKSQAAPDDVLDAAALLVTAKRILEGQATRYPSTPRSSAFGHAMQIWV